MKQCNIALSMIFIDHIVDSDIRLSFLAGGYKASCEIRRIIQMSVGTHDYYEKQIVTPLLVP